MFFVGYTLNVEDEGINRIPNDKLEEFEENIIIDGNDYQANNIEDNIFNKIGRKVEGIIDDGFSLVFKIIKGFAQDE